MDAFYEIQKDYRTKAMRDLAGITAELATALDDLCKLFSWKKYSDETPEMLGDIMKSGLVLVISEKNIFIAYNTIIDKVAFWRSPDPKYDKRVCSVMDLWVPVPGLQYPLEEF